MEESVTVRVKSGWKPFRELLPIFTNREISPITKGNVYREYVRTVILYDSEV